MDMVNHIQRTQLWVSPLLKTNLRARLHWRLYRHKLTSQFPENSEFNEARLKESLIEKRAIQLIKTDFVDYSKWCQILVFPLNVALAQLLTVLIEPNH